MTSVFCKHDNTNLNHSLMKLEISKILSRNVQLQNTKHMFMKKKMRILECAEKKSNSLYCRN